MTARRFDLMILPLLALGIALRLYNLGHWPYWTDEIATLNFSRLPPGQIWGSDTHPPLYYWIIHVWQRLGTDEATQRLSSVLVSLATLPLVYRAARLLAGRGVARWALLLQALSPFGLLYAQELRMYALLEFAGALALLGLIAVFQRPAWALGAWRGPRGPKRAWLAYGLGVLLAVYCHNTGILLPAAATLVALACWWRRADRWRLARRWCLVNAGALLLWLPYLPSYLKQSARIVGGFWARTPDLGGFGQALSLIHFGSDLADTPAGFWPSLALALLLLAVLLLGIGRLRRRPALLALLLGLALLPAGLELLAGIVKPIFVPRTLIWTALPSLLLLALGLRELSRRRAFPLLAAALAARLWFTLAVYQEAAKPDWPAVTALLAERVAPGDLVIIDPYFEQSVFTFYLERGFPGRSGFILLPVSRWTLPMAEEVIATWPPERRTLWLVQLKRTHSLKDRAGFLTGIRPCAALAESAERQDLLVERYELGPGC